MTDEPEDEVSADALFGAGEKPARKTRQAKAVVEEVRLHNVLSNEDFLLAQANARKKIDKERRIAAMKAVAAEEEKRLRREEGLTTGIPGMDDEVHILMDLPEWTPYISLNGFPFWHGRGYDVPRHVYDTLMDQMFRAQRHDDQIDGKSMRETMARANRRSPNVIDGNTGVALHDARYDA